MAWPNLRLNYHRLRGASLEAYLAGVIAQDAKAQGCTLDETPPSADRFTPDIIIKASDEGPSVLMVEIKKHPRTADISRLKAAIADTGAHAVLLSDSNAPSEVKEFAESQNVHFVEGFDNTDQVMALLTEHR